MRNKGTAKRGFILITAYMLMTTLAIFSIALFARGGLFLKTAERNKKKMVAFNAAEAGFDDAFYRIKNSVISAFPWTSGYVSLSTGNIEGGYSASVEDMGNNIKKIKVSGYSPSQSATTQSQEVRPVTGYIQSTPSTPFDFAVFAASGVTLNGSTLNLVDSYNSVNGNYGGGNMASNGDLGTNGTGAGAITLSGNVQVKGDATVGPGANTATAISTSGNAAVLGTKSAATTTTSLTTPTTNISSEGALSISGTTNYSLPAGVHRLSSLSVTGNAVLTSLGPVTLYVDGPVTISGNGVVTVQDVPKNFMIYGTSTGAISLSGNGNFHGAVYAPLAAVTNSGNGQLFGAVISKTYTQSGNGNIHFDEALKDVTGPGPDEVSVLSWTENNITAQSTSSSTDLS